MSREPQPPNARLWAVGAVGAFALFAGCQLVGGITGVEFSETGGGGVGGVGGAGLGGAGGAGGVYDECDDVPPPPDETGGSDSVDVVLAVRSVDFGEDELERTGVPGVGADLDEVDTFCDPDTGEIAADAETRCIPPDGAFSDAYCDGPCGIDNALSNVVRLVLGALLGGGAMGGSETLSREVCLGNWSILIRIFDYNGTPNDDRVSVALYPTTSISAEPCFPPGGTGGAAGVGGGGGSRPGGDPSCPGGQARWDGTDVWPVIDSGIATGQEPVMTDCVGDPQTAIKMLTPAYLDTVAYVSDGRLVASLDEAQFIVVATDVVLPFTLSGGRLNGDLVQEDGLWKLKNAIVAGRWPVSDVFAGAAGAVVNGEALCTTSTFYVPFKSAVCNHRDAPLALGSGGLCNSISYAFAATAVEAQMGNLVAVGDVLVPGCDATNDPVNDSCPE